MCICTLLIPVYECILIFPFYSGHLSAFEFEDITNSAALDILYVYSRVCTSKRKFIYLISTPSMGLELIIPRSSRILPQAPLEYVLLKVHIPTSGTTEAQAC